MSNFNTTRREFLGVAGTIGAPIMMGLPLALWPRPSFAQWQVVLAVAASVVGIVSGISGMHTNAEILSDIQEIDDKLNSVISLEYEILNEISELKMYIDQAILNGWAQSYGRDIDAYSTEFNALSVAPNQNDRQIHARWLALAQSSPQTSVRMGDVEFGIFPFFAHGVAVSQISFRMTNFPIASQRAYYARFATQIDKWLDPQNPRSITQSLATLAAEIPSRRQALDGLPSKVLINTTTEIAGNGGGAPCHRNTFYYVNISGTFDNGYSGTQSVEVANWVCPQPPPGHHPHVLDLEVAEQSITRALSPATPAGGAIPVFTPSGYAVVDARNLERIAILQLMAAQGIQQGMSAQMDILRRTLRTI